MVKDSGYEKIAARQPMQRYLLPCSCSRRITVAAAQAGGTVRCPDCGADRLVPRLGELARLEVAADAPRNAGGAGWGTAQACLLAGLVAVVAGAGTAVWLRGVRSDVAGPDAEAIRQVAATAPADEIYGAWLGFEQQGIARMPSTAEQRNQQLARMFSALETGAWAVALTGGVAAAAAFIAGRR